MGGADKSDQLISYHCMTTHKKILEGDDFYLFLRYPSQTLSFCSSCLDLQKAGFAQRAPAMTSCHCTLSTSMVCAFPILWFHLHNIPPLTAASLSYDTMIRCAVCSTSPPASVLNVHSCQLCAIFPCTRTAMMFGTAQPMTVNGGSG